LEIHRFTVNPFHGAAAIMDFDYTGCGGIRSILS